MNSTLSGTLNSTLNSTLSGTMSGSLENSGERSPDTRSHAPVTAAPTRGRLGSTDNTDGKTDNGHTGDTAPQLGAVTAPGALILVPGVEGVKLSALAAEGWLPTPSDAVNH
jgi:hypothetical protein